MAEKKGERAGNLRSFRDCFLQFFFSMRKLRGSELKQKYFQLINLTTEAEMLIPLNWIHKLQQEILQDKLLQITSKDSFIVVIFQLPVSFQQQTFVRKRYDTEPASWGRHISKTRSWFVLNASTALLVLLLAQISQSVIISYSKAACLQALH